MPQYLFPCTCGIQHRVEPVQAGEKLTCSCGQALTVPTLRALKQLALAPPEAKGQAAARTVGPRSWSPVHGAIFSAGLLAALVGLVVIAISLIQYAQVAGYTKDYTPEVHEFEGAQIDQLSPLESLEVYNELVKEGLGNPQPPVWVQAKDLVNNLWQRIRWSSVVVIAGIVLAVGTMFFKPRAAGA